MTAKVCACGCGCSLAGLRSDAVYASEACSKRHKRAASADKGPTREECRAIAEEAILDHFRNHPDRPFHADELWHVIPDEHRGVISLAVMAIRNKKLIVGCGYRNSAIPSRKHSPSKEYRLTELGRDRIAGVGGGYAAAPPSPVSAHSPHSGDGSSGAVTGHLEEPRPSSDPVPLFEEEQRPLNPLSDAEAA